MKILFLFALLVGSAVSVPVDGDGQVAGEIATENSSGTDDGTESQSNVDGGLNKETESKVDDGQGLKPDALDNGTPSVIEDDSANKATNTTGSGDTDNTADVNGTSNVAATETSKTDDGSSGNQEKVVTPLEGGENVPDSQSGSGNETTPVTADCASNDTVSTDNGSAGTGCGQLGAQDKTEANDKLSGGVDGNESGGARTKRALIGSNYDKVNIDVFDDDS